MTQQLCLMHANCQGEELERLLLASAVFRKRFHIARVTNYTREPVAEELLKNCSLFLYQQLGPGWGDFSSDNLKARLSSAARAVCLPNLFFKGCWPFWTSQSPIDFGDSLLNRLIDEGAPKAAVLRLCLHTPVAKYADFAAVLEDTFRLERQKEAFGPVKLTGYIEAHWKERPLFHTVNHPGRELLELAADILLKELDIPPLSEKEKADVAAAGPFPSYSDFDLPVHPQVAKFHGLAYGGEGWTYAVFGRRMTFEQYVSRYIDCRLSKMDKDFLSYLQLV